MILKQNRFWREEKVFRAAGKRCYDWNWF